MKFHKSRMAMAASWLLVLSLGACHAKKAEQVSSSAEHPVSSSQWVRENPTEPAVPVNLPKTIMTNAATEAVEK